MNLVVLSYSFLMDAGQQTITPRFRPFTSRMLQEINLKQSDTVELA